MMTPDTDTLPTLTVADFDYPLPKDLIARYPLPERDQSRMLVLDRESGSMAHRVFSDLVDLLEPGDVLVLNNAKVIPARLQGHREGHTGKVEIFLLHPVQEERRRWQVLMKPFRRLREGAVVVFPNSPLQARVIERGDAGQGVVELSWPEDQPFDAVLDQTGVLPIPPYLEREAEQIDHQRYQTVFAKVPGAQAAPTAGLHFTPEVLAQLQAKGVVLAEVTLYVSAGTFRPVLAEQIEAHRMDPELYAIPQATVERIEMARRQSRRVVAVGTTVVKTLESSAYNNQGKVKAETAWSELFIRPGFPFQVVDAMLTNFHLPKSTLLMLVSAFAGRKPILDAYHEAVARQYRFYSYGDCMLIQ